MINIVKKKINMNDELKAKNNWSCKFNKKSYQIIEGYLRIVEHTNLAYVELHKVIIEDKFYKRTYIKSISNDEYYKTLKEDLDNAISYSVTLKQLFERMRSLGYKIYSRNGVITIYRDGEDKIRIENVFGEEYSKERLNQRLYLSRQIVFKPMPQKSIFEEYSRINKPHKGIYGLYLYYCYLLGVFPKKHPKQYLPYSIRKEVYKLEQFSQQIRFIHEILLLKKIWITLLKIIMNN